MNTFVRITTGIVAFILGLVLVRLAILSDLFILFWGVPMVLVGIFILFNKKEDDIEQIKER